MRRLPLLVSLAVICCSRGPKLNLVLITIDTCRSDRLSCYGYDRSHTPHLDALAAEGVLFEEARTCVPITLPSHVSIMTGLYPTVHGVRENGAYVAPDSLLMLAEILKSRGYQTAAFVGSFPLESRFNVDQGFDHYGDSFGEREGLGKEAGGGVSIFFHERPADEVNAEFVHWLAEEHGEPFFAWLHYFDPHQPYEPRPPYDAICAGRPYDAEIAFVDASIGRLRRELEERGLLERTIVVVTSDHGESLGEHGERSHALLLYDTTLKVPLIIRCPEEMGVVGRVRQHVRTVDLVPTVLELMGVQIDGRWQGRSLVGLMRGEGGTEHEHYYETFFGRLHFGWSVLAGYHAGAWKYIHGPEPELYDVSQDGAEATNLISTHPDVAAELRDELLALLAEGKSAAHSLFAEPDNETAARLEALGYVGSWQAAGPAEDWFVGPNPVEMMDAHEWFNLGRNYVHEGMWLEATEVFNRALEANPDNKDARLGLVHAYTRLGEPSAALAEALDAVARYPHEGRLWLIVSRLRIGQGRLQEALRSALRGLDEGADPVDAWMLVGECHELLHETADAVQAYRRVLGIDPSQYRGRFGLARVLALTGDLAGAEREFDAALEANPYWAPGRYNYGVFLLQHDDRQSALDEFRKAVRLDNNYPAAHHAAAILLHEQGDDTAALEHLEAVVRYAVDPARREAAQALMDAISGRAPT
jgi:arylsulfatase A-like enzyme/Tfp pilus assembly protein PilF